MGDVERAHGGEANEVEGWNGSAGAAEEDDDAARAQTLERLLEGGLANGVVDCHETTAFGEGFDFGGEVFVGVEDDLVGPGGAGESGLFFGGDGGEDAGSASPGHLDEKTAGAAGSGVDEDLVAGLDGIGGVAEVMGGHALKESGRGLLGGDPVGDGDEAVGGGDGKLRVGSGDGAPGDAVSGFDGGDIVGDGDDGACGLLPEGVWKLGGVTAFAEVGVDEVDAGGFDSDERFAGTRSGGGKIAEGEDVGGTGGEDLDGLHGRWMPEYNMT